MVYRGGGKDSLEHLSWEPEKARLAASRFKEHAPKDVRVDSDFDAVVIGLTSPEFILRESYGEVTTHETQNHRTGRPEEGGPFCERIFGPIEDLKCACRKYKGIKYKYTVCDRCGVEVNERKVRRERMGHIQLAVPVVHPWFFRYLPNKIGSLLGISSKDLESIIYYVNYVVVQPGIRAENGLRSLEVLSERAYQALMDDVPAENKALPDDDPNKVVVKIGGEAIEMLLKRLDLDKLSASLRRDLTLETSQQQRAAVLKRLHVVEAFRDSRNRVENKPEWMVLRYILVMPPEKRPLMILDTGKVAMSDLTMLYRNVIIRNNRLMRLLSVGAPCIILRNEMRMLQEIVEALLDNSRQASPVASENGRPLKSLSDEIKGKQGVFRHTMLGKRVDYSGRSVITVGPKLKLHECGLPKEMAAELFRPFIIRRLRERGLAATVKDAQQIINRKEPVIWDILEQHLKGHPVLLNRAPTLHRLGIQAFQPKLIEERAIQLHPLVCTAFNADFDGDQMAVHVPLSEEAITEAIVLMLSTNNILNPSNGLPITLPSKDMVLGLYYLTLGRRSTPEYPILGEGMVFSDTDEVLVALGNQKVSKHAFIRVRLPIVRDGKQTYEIVETVVGRVMFNQLFPKGFRYINDPMTSKRVQSVVAEVYRSTKLEETVKFLDSLKSLGFQSCYEGGLTFGLDDIKVPVSKPGILRQAEEEVEGVKRNYQQGLITGRERYNQIIGIWSGANERLTAELLEGMSQDKQGFNSVYMMLSSGARGSREQMRQIVGMRGLMTRPQQRQDDSEGAFIEDPIKQNFYEGLDPFGYVASCIGARKGLTDTALRTADAGYLGRKLVDVSQSVIVNHENCNTPMGLCVTTPFGEDEVVGRYLAADVISSLVEQPVALAGQLITQAMLDQFNDAKIEHVVIRSPLYCEAENGVCAICYGHSLATLRDVQLGEAVGIIAAQSIAEPCTQLTLKTFHFGGAASLAAVDSEIKAGASGVVQFEHMKWVPAPGDNDGRVVIGKMGELRILDPKTNQELANHHVPYAAHLLVKEGDIVEKNDKLCYWDPYNALILTASSGVVSFESLEEGLTYKEEYDEHTGHTEQIVIENRDRTKAPSILVRSADKQLYTYNLPLGAHLLVKPGAQVVAGQVIAKIPRAAMQSRDIVGGLPRVTELFEARVPANTAEVAMVDGIVSYGAIKRGNREIVIQAKDGSTSSAFIPLSKYVLVQDGDFVKSGTALSAGSVAIGTILASRGPQVAMDYIINEIQEVYKRQGVRINHKHFEVVLRQMTQKVEIVDSGDTMLLPGRVLPKVDFRKTNLALFDQWIVIENGGSDYQVGDRLRHIQYEQERKRLQAANLPPLVVRAAEPAIARRVIQGVSTAAKDAASFLSAASFQSPIGTLTNAAVAAKKDELRGIKESVILCKRIPAGTGFPAFNRVKVSKREEASQGEFGWNDYQQDRDLDLDLDQRLGPDIGQGGLSLELQPVREESLGNIEQLASEQEGIFG